MRVAAEHIYERDENGEPYRLAIARGDAVSKDDMKRLGVKESQVVDVDDPAALFEPADEG